MRACISSVLCVTVHWRRGVGQVDTEKYYKALGVEKTASQGQIKKAYFKLAKEVGDLEQLLYSAMSSVLTAPLLGPSPASCVVICVFPFCFPFDFSIPILSAAP